MLSALLSEPTNGIIPVVADDIFSEINRVFNTRSLNNQRGFPLDLIEKSDHYLIRAALPGILMENIEVVAEGNVISIRVEQNQHEKPNEDMKYLRRELSESRQIRNISLPDNADSGSAEGSLKNGILELYIKKREESLPKKISISS